MRSRSAHRDRYRRKQSNEGTSKSPASQVILSLGEGLLAAMVFALGDRANTPRPRGYHVRAYG